MKQSVGLNAKRAECFYLIVIRPRILESCGESADNKAWNLGVKEGEKKSPLE